jgi:murein DD-endopeptidase MepM/ murein hydrolase activator NlpD
VLGKVDYGEKDARFGAPRSGHVHAGQDMFAKPGTPLVSVRDGVVVDRGKVNGRYSGGRGNYVAIYSPLDDVSFVYFHMLKPPPVLVGDEVDAGQEIGQLGCTGTCFGPHLHFEIRRGKATLRADTKAVDPLPYLQGWPQAAPATP